METKHTFSTVDYVLFIGSLVGSLMIGLYYVFCKKQDTHVDFLMAGRSMSTFPVAMSLLASFISAITILAIPAEVYYNGIQFYVVTLSMCLSVVVVAFIFMPLLYNLKVTSIYEYLELRFESRLIRQLATFTFMVKNEMYMSVVLYTPALALSVVTPLPTWASILTVGVICSIYTGFGGLRAVLWTDVFQVLMMLAGLLAVVIEGCVQMGGVGNVWRIAAEHGRSKFFDFSFDPFKRLTFWILLFGPLFNWTSIYACTQTSAQRYLSMKTFEQAKTALLANIPLIVIVNTIAFFSGIVAFAVYVDCDPLAAGVISKNDQIMPYFVMDKLGYLTGLPGLFVACVFSASLSTLSSGLNALAAVTWEDFVQHSSLGHWLIERELSLAANKAMALLYGVISVAFAFAIGSLGTVLNALVTVSGAVTGPLLSAFLLAIFYPWCNKQGALAGMCAGYIICGWLAIGSQVTKAKAISEPLEVSIEGCPESWNITHVEKNQTYISPLDKELFEISDIYRISYFLYTLIGTVIGILVALPVSYLTGNYPAETLDPALVSPLLRKYVRQDEKKDVQLKTYTNNAMDIVKE